MKIKHTLELNGAELELEVYVRITSWDSDDRGRPVIEDLEFEQIEYTDDTGKKVIAEGEIEQEILNILDNDSDFASKVYAEAYEEGEDALREMAIQRAESARESRYEEKMGRC
jgi:hypothetical protein